MACAPDDVTDSCVSVPAISSSPVASLLMTALWPTATFLMSFSSMVTATFSAFVSWMVASAVPVLLEAIEPTVAFRLVMVPDAVARMVQSAICSSSSSIWSAMASLSSCSFAESS